MSRICQLCGKGYTNSNLVPRGVGNRVTKRTNIRRMANLRSKRFLINGVKTKIILCAACLKRIKKDVVAAQAAVVSK